MNACLRSKVNEKGAVKSAPCLAWADDRTASEVEHFHSSPTISTLLHVAIMRDKALSNEQLHIVRSVPITNHCVWRKTFLCTNIPAHSSLALPPHQERRKMQPVGRTPLLKGQAAVTHIHVWDSGGIQTACIACGFLQSTSLNWGSCSGHHGVPLRYLLNSKV